MINFEKSQFFEGKVFIFPVSILKSFSILEISTFFNFGIFNNELQGPHCSAALFQDIRTSK